MDPNLEQNTANWLRAMLTAKQPQAPVTAGPTHPTAAAQATFQFSRGTGATTKCALDGSLLTSCTSPINYSGLPAGLHSFTVRATDSTGHTGDPYVHYWTISPVVVSVADYSFSPSSPRAVQGAWVQWNFVGPSLHTVTDSSGMGLFDSGAIGPGGTYRLIFPSAGIYNYQCTIHSGMTGKIKVPMTVSPTTGPPGTVFTITWAASLPPAGYVYDVQVKPPGALSWSNWMTNQTLVQATTKNSVVGTYYYRARLKNSGNGKASAWSSQVSLTVV